MVGWGPEATDIENPQKVASSEGEELYVGTSPFVLFHIRVELGLYHQQRLM
jgi:hypothetical protein